MPIEEIARNIWEEIRSTANRPEFDGRIRRLPPYSGSRVKIEHDGKALKEVKDAVMLGKLGRP